MDTESSFSLSDLLGVLVRRSWIIVLCVLIVGGAAYLYSKQQQVLYAAAAKVVLNNDIQLPGSNANPANNPLAAQRAAQTKTVLAKSEPVAAEALSLAGDTHMT